MVPWRTKESFVSQNYTVYNLITIVNLGQQEEIVIQYGSSLKVSTLHSRRTR